MPTLEVMGKWSVPLTQGYTIGARLTGQATKLRVDGTIIWIREYLESNSIDQFMTNASERMRRKVEGPRGGKPVLQLACLPNHFDFMAGVVRDNDGLNRRVVKAHGWSLKTAPDIVRVQGIEIE